MILKKWKIYHYRCSQSLGRAVKNWCLFVFIKQIHYIRTSFNLHMLSYLSHFPLLTQECKSTEIRHPHNRFSNMQPIFIGRNNPSNPVQKLTSIALEVLQLIQKQYLPCQSQIQAPWRNLIISDKWESDPENKHNSNGISRNSNTVTTCIKTISCKFLVNHHS